MKNYNMTLPEKQQKYQHYHQVKLININILQMKKYHSLLGKALEKQRKTIEDQGRKHNKRLVALTNKDDHKDNYKEIFKKLVKEKFDEIKKLTDEINQNELIY